MTARYTSSQECQCIVGKAAHLVLPVLIVLLFTWTPSYGQQPASCPAPSWSVGTPTIPPDRPESRVGAFAGKLYTQSSAGRTFQGSFKARAADQSGLGLLSCILEGECGLDDLLGWIFQLLDWSSFSKAELARNVYVTPQGPAGADVRIQLEGRLEGLLAVSSVGLAASDAKVSADVWAQPGEESLRTVLHEVQEDATAYDSTIRHGVFFTPVFTSASQNVILSIGEQLFLEGYLRAESNSFRLANLGAALGAAQFHEAVGGGFFDLLNPPISIPDPGLKMIATIINVSPVLTVNQSSVGFEFGQEARNSGTLCDGDADPVQLTASDGIVTNNHDGTWSWSLPAGAGINGRTVTISATDKEVTRHRTFQLVPSLKIDVGPKSTSNTIDLQKDGRIAVAILGAPGFAPASDVSLASLRFGATGNEDSLLRLGAAQKPACSGGDLNDDGLWDLGCEFQVAAMAFQCGDRVGILQAVVSPFGSASVNGRDGVRLVPCNTIRTPTVIYEDGPLRSGIQGVAVSPDGTTLYVGSGGAIFSIPEGGGVPTQISGGDLGYISGLAVSRDGFTVFVTLLHSGLASANPVVVSVPAGGGAAVVVADLPVDSQPGGLAVSPDGISLLVAVRNPVRTLLSLPLLGGTSTNVLSGEGFEFITDVDVPRWGQKLYLGADGTDEILIVPAAGTPTAVPTNVEFVDPVNIALAPDSSTLFVMDPNIRIDASGRVVGAGGWPGAVFMGPGTGGHYVPLVVGGPDFELTGRIDLSPDGSVLYLGGTRRSTGAPVILSVLTGPAE